MSSSQETDLRIPFNNQLKVSKVSQRSQINFSDQRDEEQDELDAQQQQQGQYNDAQQQQQQQQQSHLHHQHSVHGSQLADSASNQYSQSNFIGYAAEGDRHRTFQQCSVQEIVRLLEDELKPNIQPGDAPEINNIVLDDEERRVLEQGIARGSISVVSSQEISRFNNSSRGGSQKGRAKSLSQKTKQTNSPHSQKNIGQPNLDNNDGLEEILVHAKSHRSHNSQLQSNVQQFRVYRRRYLIAVLYTVSLATQSVLYSTTTPIASTLQKIYDKSSAVVALASLLFLLMHPIFTIPSSYVIELPKYDGIRIATILGSILIIIGVWMRCLVNVSFDYVIWGSAIIGIGRTFLINQTTKIVVNWFSPEQRASMTAFFNFVILAATVIGVAIPTLVFYDYKYDKVHITEQQIEDGRSLTKRLMIIEGIMASVCLVPGMIFTHGKAPSPPSFAAIAPKTDNMKQSLKELGQNRNFIFITLTYSLYYGMFKAFVAIISFLAACFNFTLLDITIFSIAPVLSGFPTNVLMGMYIKKYPHYKLFGSILSLSTVLIMAAAYPMFNTSKLWVTLINTVLLGVVLMPMISLMVEFAMEVSYPCGESISVGILFSGGQIFGVIIGEIGSIILDHQTRKNALYTLIFFCIIVFFSLVALQFSTQDLRRRHEEQLRQKVVEKINSQIKKSNSKGNIMIVQHVENSSQKISII